MNCLNRLWRSWPAHACCLPACSGCQRLLCVSYYVAARAAPICGSCPEDMMIWVSHAPCRSVVCGAVFCVPDSGRQLLLDSHDRRCGSSGDKACERLPLHHQHGLHCLSIGQPCVAFPICFAMTHYCSVHPTMLMTCDCKLCPCCLLPVCLHAQRTSLKHAML